MEKLERIKEVLDDLDESELISMWNEYQSNINGDGTIFNNCDEFFEEFYNNDVMGALRASHYGNYNLSDEYVMFNGYGNLKSFNYVTDVIDMDELAKYILDEEDSLYNDDIEEILEEEEEEEE